MSAARIFSTWHFSYLPPAGLNDPALASMLLIIPYGIKYSIDREPVKGPVKRTSPRCDRRR
jgi:hypothetical protein